MRLLRALGREKVDRPPIWLMRQAGRYLPEYRALRQKAGSFLNLCKNPEWAAEITLQPLARFPLDAAIVFADILLIPEAMNRGLSFVEEIGPRFERPIRSQADVAALPILDPERELGYVMKTLRLVKTALQGQLPLIGFAGSPWTVASYMVEGASSSSFGVIKKMLYVEPLLAHALLEKLTENTILYLQAQIAAGAEVLMLFDSWGGMLSAAQYDEFSLAYMAKIIQAVPSEIPVILFTKGGGLWLEKMVATGARALGLDWTIDLQEAKLRVGQQVALQGNLDPAILYTNPAVITAAARDLLDVYAGEPGYIFNLGHGVPKDVPLENVEALIAAVVGDMPSP